MHSMHHDLPKLEQGLLTDQLSCAYKSKHEFDTQYQQVTSTRDEFTKQGKSALFDCCLKSSQRWPLASLLMRAIVLEAG